MGDFSRFIVERQRALFRRYWRAEWVWLAGVLHWPLDDLRLVTIREMLDAPER